MLEVKINQGEVNIKSVDTTMPILMTDLTMLFRTIYEDLNEKEKEEFDFGLKRMIEEKLYSKNEEEIVELNKELMKKVLFKLLFGESKENIEKLKEFLK